jgi:uncharacterized RDD family membrane protein YckC
MGLISCPDCGHHISDVAITCIQCGRPCQAGAFAPVGAGASPWTEPDPAPWIGTDPGLASDETAANAPAPDGPAGEWSPAPAPWPRYFARYIDCVFGMVVIAVILGVTLPELVDDPSFEMIALVLALVGWIFLEAQLLTSFGTTPGKWLLRLRVLRPDGSRLSYGAALRRSIHVFVAGMGLCIPLVTMVTMLVSRERLLRDGRTAWDAEYQVTHAPIGPARVLALIGICLVVAVLSVIPWE